jgi:plastocyanin
MRVGRDLRIGGAVALLVAGLAHLDLYFGGYRSAGSVPSFGRSILLNAIVSVVVAVAVGTRREWFVRLAGIAVAVATLAAFTYTHTGHTFLGFQGAGLAPSPQALLVLVAEIAAIVLLAATFIPPISERDRSSPVSVLIGAGAIAAVGFIAAGIYWAEKYDTTAGAGGPASVVITDFRFQPQVLTVPKGTTVTWLNNDSLDHSVVAADQSFSSGALRRGNTFQFTFDKPGDVTYACGFHPEMTGTVNVTE